VTNERPMNPSLRESGSFNSAWPASLRGASMLFRSLTLSSYQPCGWARERRNTRFEGRFEATSSPCYGDRVTIAYWCVLAAALLPYAFTSFAKFSGPGFNNYKPREFLEKLDGARKRAHWAQLNSFESFPMFAAAVIIAHQLHAEQSTLNLLAIAYVALRAFYGIFYIANKAPLRSLVWFASMGCIVGLFVISAR
jgi:uncharacterized MAPEG superfamily protein